MFVERPARVSLSIAPSRATPADAPDRLVALYRRSARSSLSFARSPHRVSFMFLIPFLVQVTGSPHFFYPRKIGDLPSGSYV